MLDRSRDRFIKEIRGSSVELQGDKSFPAAKSLRSPRLPAASSNQRRENIFKMEIAGAHRFRHCYQAQYCMIARCGPHQRISSGKDSTAIGPKNGFTRMTSKIRSPIRPPGIFISCQNLPAGGPREAKRNICFMHQGKRVSNS